MFKYNVQVKKVSGRLNESVLPSKNLVVKSKTEKTDKEVFAEASKYYKEKYGLVIESGNVYRNRASQKSMAIRILTRPMVIREDELRTLKPLMYQPYAE
jgi:histone acetyltransferase (RNA polymerase elongator complex component)